MLLKGQTSWRAAEQLLELAASSAVRLAEHGIKPLEVRDSDMALAEA